MRTQTFRVVYDSNNSGGDWWLSDDDWRKLEAAGWTVPWGGLDFCHSESRWSFDEGKPHTAPNTCAKRDCHGHRFFESADDAIAAGKAGRWLGALAREAYIDVEAYSADLAEGIAKEWWQDALGMDADAEGCSCCGSPHSFYAREAAVPA